MNWYNAFNAAEAGLWATVAVIIPARVACATRQQWAGVTLACAAFLAFGGTDLLEIGREGSIPMWLWAAKVACGTMILSARYTWLGWNRFRWHNRDVLFGVACLASVGVLIALQWWIEPRRW